MGSGDGPRLDCDLIEFKQLRSKTTTFRVMKVLSDGEHVGFWGTHEGAAITLIRDLSESEIDSMLKAATELRGFVPEVIVQPKARPKGN